MISGTILPPISTSHIPAASTRTPSDRQQDLKPKKSFKKTVSRLDVDVGNITRLAARPNFFGGNRATNLNSSCLVIADDPKSPESRPAFKGLRGCFNRMAAGRQHLIRRLLQDRLLNHTKAPESSARVGVAPLF
jgi:hypothetical protein